MKLPATPADARAEPKNPASTPEDASKTTMRNFDAQPPTPARRNAQLRQLIRLAQCPHPQNSLIIRLLAEGGFIEYCSDCNRITDLFDRPKGKP